MIISTNQLYLSTVLPLDSKESNVVITGNSVKVETTEEYFERVDINSRYLGLEVYLLTPAGTYAINDFINFTINGGISAAKYKFANISDDSLLLVVDSVVVVNDLVTGGVSDALSAEQGIVLKNLIDTKAPMLGEDDNYVTDLEKVIIGNTSNLNSGDNATNTQYSSLVSNVTTNLSEGTSTVTTVDVNSSDGTNATLVAASTSRAGVMTKAKFDEVVVNNAKVSYTDGAAVALNTTHRTSDGSDHSFIDQDITTTSSPTFNELGVSTLTVAGHIEITDTGNSVFIGEGAGKNDDLNSHINIFIGKNAGEENITGRSNIAIGQEALRLNVTNMANVAIGTYSLCKTTGSEGNVAMGRFALGANNCGSFNTAIGNLALYHNKLGNNTALGNEAGSEFSGGINWNNVDSVFIGACTKAQDIDNTNQIVIGTNAIGNGSNTATLGDDNVTDVYAGENGTANIHGKLITTPTIISTATYTVLPTDRKLHVTRAATGTCLITIPTALITSTFDIVIKDGSGNAATNNITIASEGSELFDGEATVVIAGDYNAINLYSDGINLFIY